MRVLHVTILASAILASGAARGGDRSLDASQAGSDADFGRAYREAMAQAPSDMPVSRPSVQARRARATPSSPASVAPETYTQGLTSGETAPVPLRAPQDRAVGVRLRPAQNLTVGAELTDPEARRGTGVNMNWSWRPVEGSRPAGAGAAVTWGAGISGRADPSQDRLDHTVDGQLGLRAALPGAANVAVTPQLRPRLSYDHTAGRPASASVTPALGATASLPRLPGAELGADIAYPVPLTPGERSPGLRSGLRLTVRSR